jgi:hypothetical protein
MEDATYYPNADRREEGFQGKKKEDENQKNPADLVQAGDFVSRFDAVELIPENSDGNGDKNNPAEEQFPPAETLKTFF